MYELIIIGGGPAGMTAAVYAARKKLTTLVVTPYFGGQALRSIEVENYLGYHLVSGQELMAKFQDHLTRFPVDTELTTVIDLRKKDSAFLIKTASGKEFESKTVIIASGKTPRKLQIPGEDEFLGQGVTYCVTCDGPLFEGMDVAVIGGGNAALDAALQMSKISSKVYLVSFEPWIADEITQVKVESTPNIIPYVGHQIAKIGGSNFVENITITETATNQEINIPVKGVFIEIGSVAATSFCHGLVELNELGEIKIDCKGETNVPGIFAAGDVSDVPEKQIIIAAGEGAKAALSAYKYLITHK